MPFDLRVTSTRGLARGMGPLGNFGLAPTWQAGTPPSVLASAVRNDAPGAVNFGQPAQPAQPPLGPPPISPQFFQPGIDTAFQEGTSTAPTTPLGGLARVGQALVAAKMRGAQMDAQQAMRQYQGDAVVKALTLAKTGDLAGAAGVMQNAGMDISPVVAALMKPPDWRDPVAGVDPQGNPVYHQFNSSGGERPVQGLTPNNAPSGYKGGPTGLAPIPGGPADPATLATNAAAAQQPPAGYRAGPNSSFVPVAGGPADLDTIAAQEGARNPWVLQQSWDPAKQSMTTIAVPRAQITQAVQAGGQPPAGGGPGMVVGQGAPNEQVQRNANLAIEANSALQEARAKILNPDGTINRAVVNTMFVNFAGSPGRAARAQFDTALANLVYIKSGAQAGPAELASARAQYMPSPLDNDATVLDKMRRMQAFFDQVTPTNTTVQRGSQPQAGAAGGAAVPPPPAVGEVRDGYRFKGGDPGDQNAWEAVR